MISDKIGRFKTLIGTIVFILPGTLFFILPFSLLNISIGITLFRIYDSGIKSLFVPLIGDIFKQEYYENGIAIVSTAINIGAVLAMFFSVYLTYVVYACIQYS